MRRALVAAVLSALATAAVLATVTSVLLTGRLLARELTGRALNARDVPSRERSRMLSTRRSRLLGFGVKFEGEGLMAGQNARAFPVITQYIDDKAYVVWPKSLQLREPVLPLPASSPYAAK